LPEQLVIIAELIETNNDGDIASIAWPFFDFRADKDVGHNDLLNNVPVLDRLIGEYDFQF
jgi:hypothetical protein